VYNSEAHTFHIAASVGGVPEVDEQMVGADMPGRVMSGLLAAATPISQSYFVDSRRHVWTDEEHYWSPGEVEGTPAPDEWQDDDALLVPMVSDREQLIGYIEAYEPRDRQLPTLETVRLLELFAAQAASSIELHRLYEALAEQARTDGLTGIANHRAFSDCLEQEVAKAVRYGTPVSLLMIDIDNFKPFNDTYGHPQGDKLLKEMAALLLASTRENVDLVARYGGEEFVVVLPNTPSEGAAHLAERLRGDVSEDERSGLTVAEAIRQAMVQTAFEGSPDKPEVRVTVSVGVASFPDHASSAEELVANSDKALYLAKRLGKNCVELFH
jgi:diguanylate cyclase (GGDEF)-like protein